MSRQFGPLGSRNTEKYVRHPEQNLQSTPGGNRVHALSLEFVAKPSEAQRAQSAVPAAINGTLQGVAGFGGCLVMSADQEARLMKVITFWNGPDAARRCTQNTRWLCKLLEPFLDGGLKCRTYVTHMPIPLSYSPMKEDAAVPVALEAKPEEMYAA